MAQGRRGLALTVCCPTALTLLSVTTVNTGLPAIRSRLGSGTVGQSVTLTVYEVVLTFILVPAGRLSDQYGNKPVFTSGVAVLAAGHSR